ncbi:MAG TPA: DUF3332 family protein [Planctomycetota bacterium]|jgi:hypothetical protein|nr:DUF3332 family protein [Planctomycetota bacterium]
MKIKTTLLAAVLATIVGTSSCLGPDHAYGQVRSWNAQLSDQDWLKEVVFIGLWIIPVYPVALLGDVVVFNTIGYWGENPIKDPGPFPGFHKK